MRMMRWSFWVMIVIAVLSGGVFCSRTEAQTTVPRFRALVLTEKGGQHGAYVDAALKWLDSLAARENFAYDVYTRPDTFDDALLAKYKVFIQLNFPPYTWKDVPMAAFRKYIEEGRGGWVGFHHATLLGEFDGYPMWNWFSDFMGGIRFKNYIAGLAAATVNVEDPKNPVMKGVPSSFTVTNDEWYTYNKSPRPNVHVIASVDESTYKPSSDIKMGDHPVVWTNEKMKARNVYIFMGHHPDLWQNDAYTTLVRNSILWAAGQ
jgi:uncharacterized protein